MPSNSPIVLLKEMRGDRYLPIWIGAVEATSIAFAQQGMVSLRPLTHDLFCEVLDAVGVRLSSTSITALTDGIFYSDLYFSNGKAVSARPSDAIALAIRTGATILVASEILAETGVGIPDDADSAEDASGPPTGARDSGQLYPEDNVTDRAARNVSIPAPRVYETKQLEVVGVRVEMPSNSPIVLLKEMRGDRYLPIWIGAVEATAIAFAQQGMVSLRPLTHDLFCEVLDVLGVRLSSTIITSLTDGIFYTDLNLSNGRTVSARPSDGIALAMRTRAPILVTTQILDEVGVEIPEHTKESSTELKQ